MRPTYIKIYRCLSVKTFWRKRPVFDGRFNDVLIHICSKNVHILYIRFEELLKLPLYGAIEILLLLL